MLFPVIVQSELVSSYPEQTIAFAKKMYSSPVLMLIEEKINKLRRRSFSCIYDNTKFKSINGQKLDVFSWDSKNYKNFRRMVSKGLTNAREAYSSNKRLFPAHPYGVDDYLSGFAYGDEGIVTGAAIASDIPLFADNQREKYKSIFQKKAKAEELRGLMTGAVGSLFALCMMEEFDLVEEILDKRIEGALNDTGGGRLFDEFPGTLLGILRTTQLIPGHTASTEHLLDAVENLFCNYLSSPDQYAPIDKSRNFVTNAHEDQNSGLLYGHLGLAWLFKETYEITGDEKWLVGVNQALKNELSGYELDSVGKTLQLVQGHRGLPYLATGSAGFGVVLADLQPEDIAEEIQATLPALKNAAEANFSVFPGLFNGFSGLALGHMGISSFLGESRKSYSEVLEVIAAYAIKDNDSVVFAGDNGMRITSDIASGGAGIGLALSRLEQGICDFLPRKSDLQLNME